MLSPAVLFAAAITGLQILVIYSGPVAKIDFRTLLQLAQQQGRQSANDIKFDFVSKQTKHNKNYGSLTSNEIIDLIDTYTRNPELDVQNDESDYKDLSDSKTKPSNRHKNNKRADIVTYGHYDQFEELNGNRVDDDSHYVSNVQHRDKYRDEDERYKHSRFNELALEELLTENVLDNEYKDKPIKKVLPSSLVGSYSLSNDDSHNSGDEYSKVYVILNPKAIQKSRNKDELNSLLEKILSWTASSLGRNKEKQTKEHHYKMSPGLLTRRARRDSREMYAKDADEDDYKPKRSRHDRGGGGGGGGGGRTAIPYIRHRGDIYERDN